MKKIRLWLLMLLGGVDKTVYDKQREQWWMRNTRLEAENKRLREDLQEALFAITTGDNQ